LSTRPPPGSDITGQLCHDTDVRGERAGEVPEVCLRPRFERRPPTVGRHPDWPPAQKSRGPLFVCRACLVTWRCKSSAQPDGGEGQATRKGGTARCRLKEAIAKMRPDGQEPDNEAVASGRVGKRPRSPSPSSVAAVNPAGVHRRRPSLPRETCRMSQSRD